MNLNYTLIGQSITFIIFVLFCMKYVWPALLGVMQEREKRIADGLEAAERAQKDLELAKQKASTDLKDAKAQAATIVEQANKRASQIIDEAKAAALVEAQRIKANADAELEREVARAREQLRSKVSYLALVGAEKVLAKSIDKNAHESLLQSLAAEL